MGVLVHCLQETRAGLRGRGSPTWATGGDALASHWVLFLYLYLTSTHELDEFDALNRSSI